MARDNFAQDTINKLAERVGFLCSNPDCAIHTVGPNLEPTKSTRIGEAAHITAASPGGPRYDPNLSQAARSHISNGIWLCSNCADFIDKDKSNYSTELLNEWKAFSEAKMVNNLKGKRSVVTVVEENPYLEVELVWTDGGRSRRGSSEKNPEEMHEGKLVKIIPAGGGIWRWELNWNYHLKIHNNSKYPAYNVRIEKADGPSFTSIETLPKINNIQPFENKQLNVSYRTGFEGQGREADEILKPKIPNDLDKMSLDVVYYDDERNEHLTSVMIAGPEVVNIKK